MLHSMPSGGAASCADTAPLSLPAPSPPDQGAGAPNPARTLGWWNDETLAEVALATVALEAAWPLNHPADDVRQIEQEDSEQTADEWSIETPTIAPARSWVKPLAVWVPEGRDRRFASATRNRRLPLGPAQPTSPSLFAPDKRPEKSGVILVTAELMGDPTRNYLRTEFRQDEGRSVEVGQDD